MNLSYFSYIDKVNLSIYALAEGSVADTKIIESMSVDEYYTLQLTKANYIQRINDSLNKEITKS